MVDSQRLIIKQDGGSDAHAVIACWRCEKRTYVYAEDPNLPVTIGELPKFCRHCGKATEAWEMEYIREWSPSEEKVNVRSEDE